HHLRLFSHHILVVFYPHNILCPSRYKRQRLKIVAPELYRIKIDIYMSVQELQACIEEVSADIERQKEVLKKLEKSKSALQRQLNDVRDPVARLPLEISSTILTLCLPSLSRPSALLAPLLFLNVCNAWTDIAVSTRALWAAIHIEFPRADGFSEFLGTWLTRARNHPLSISLHGAFDDDIDDGIATVIQQHTEHLKALEIFSDNGNALILPTRLAPFPSLETFTAWEFT
ncbi:hypothetical protein DFH09DRAFT_1416820, partial [Mycena vulgaris]